MFIVVLTCKEECREWRCRPVEEPSRKTMMLTEQHNVPIAVARSQAKTFVHTKIIQNTAFLPFQTADGARGRAWHLAQPLETGEQIRIVLRQPSKGGIGTPFLST